MPKRLRTSTFRKNSCLRLFCLGVLSFCCCSCSGGAGTLDLANHQLLRRSYLAFCHVELACIDSLAYSQSGDVHVNLVRKLVHRTANLYLSYANPQTATLLNTLGVTENVYRNCDLNRLVLGNREEVDVDSVVSDRIILCVVKDARMNLTVDVYVDNVRLRSVRNLLDVCQWNGNVQMLGSVAVDDARNVTGSADLLEILLCSDLSLGSVQCNNLHNFKI